MHSTCSLIKPLLILAACSYFVSMSLDPVVCSVVEGVTALSLGVLFHFIKEVQVQYHHVDSILLLFQHWRVLC